MRKFKRWLIDRILPVWAKEQLRKENAELREIIREQETHIRELNACIDGMQFCVRYQQRITVNNKEVRE